MNQQFATKRELIEQIESDLAKMSLPQLKRLMSLQGTQQTLKKAEIDDCKKRIESENYPLSIFGIP